MLSRRCLVGGDEVCRQLIAGTWVGGGAKSASGSHSYQRRHACKQIVLGHWMNHCDCFCPMYLCQYFTLCL